MSEQQPKECQHVKHLCTYPEECAEETTSGECSRPHPTLQAPVATLPTCNYAACRIFEECATRYDDDEAPPCTKYQSKEHDAAIARKAREKVLKEAIEKIWGFQRDHIGMNPLVYRGLDYAREEIESLRQQEGGQEQPR